VARWNAERLGKPMPPPYVPAAFRPITEPEPEPAGSFWPEARHYLEPSHLAGYNRLNHKPRRQVFV
jgi:hypothetical protein